MRQLDPTLRRNVSPGVNLIMETSVFILAITSTPTPIVFTMIKAGILCGELEAGLSVRRLVAWATGDATSVVATTREQ